MKSESFILKDIVNIRYGKDHKKLAAGSIPLYGTGGIMRHVDSSLYDKPSVLIPRKGSLSNLYYIDEPFWTVDTLFYTEIDDSKVFPKFLYYKLKTYNLSNMNVGSAVPSLTTKVLNSLEIDLPNLNEQKKIASILSSLDNLIAENKKINEKLEEILLVNLSNHLKKIKDKYRIGNLNLTISDHVANGSFKSLKENVEVVTSKDFALFLRNIDLKNEMNKDLRYITESSYEYLKKSRLYGNEVIISNVADVGTVHRVPKIDFPMVAGNNVIFLQSEERTLTDYLYVYFRSRFGQNDIKGITAGSAQQKFNKTDFRNLKIPIIDSKTIQFEFTPILEYIDRQKEMTKTLISISDTLLPKLMSGELSVSDLPNIPESNN